MRCWSLNCLFVWYMLLLATILSLHLTSTEEVIVHLQMQEETPPFTRIGAVGPSLPEGLGSKLHYLTDSDFFSVTPNAGEIRVTRLVDRERLCPEHKLCCGVLACQLEARVFVTNRLTGEFAASVIVKVDIHDQNDNRPMFASANQKVSVSEGAPVGSYITLTPALDGDVEPANQIQRYALVEPTGTFSLDVTELPAVRLQLMKPLDRERTELYTATLEACDPGACTRQALEIYILDENDNKPVFDQGVFVQRLMENVKVGQTVLRLNATDADSGERGRVVYTLHGTVDPDLLETFELISDTGEIRLKRNLAANIRDEYHFKVIACDAVTPSCSGDTNSTADVTFTVEDVNNFAPSIQVVASGAAIVLEDESDQTESSGTDGLVVLENTPPGQVAVITVKDADLGENARVHCAINESVSASSNPDFVLSPSAPGIYSLRTSRMFDYEIEPTVRTKVVCHDFGSPQRLTAARLIVVKVSDVNEFQPEFSRRVYTGRVPENAPAGMEILTTVATDRDRGAVMRYALAPASMQQVSWNRANADALSIEQADVNRHFVLDPESGTLRTSQIPLDRETMASVTLVVIATDAKLPPILTATTTVSVDILDENDNVPVFVTPPAESTRPAASPGAPSGLEIKSFTVSENSPRFTRLSEQLEARDPDQGDNGRLVFSLLSTYALTRTNRAGHRSFQRNDFSEDRRAAGATMGDTEDEDSELLSEYGYTKKLVDHPIFRITPDGGIETLVELDREAVPAYVLKIGVQDRAAQPLSSTTTLRVDVLDTNDNAPVWIFPTPADRMINLTTAMKPGNLAGRLRADDADMANAGKVDYMFLGPRGELLKAVSMEEGLIKSLAAQKDEDQLSDTNSESVPVPEIPTRSANGQGYRVGPFYLNGTTGEIWIAELLTAGTINLHLRAKDRGNPSSQTDAWLTINVFVDPSEELGFFNFGGDGTLNITIILVMITITAVVSLFLIVGIVCVRRRPARYVAARGTQNGGGDVAGVPKENTSPFAADATKEAMLLPPGSWSTPTGMYATGHYYPNQGQLVGAMMDDGQYFTQLGNPGVLGYGAMMTPPDGHSIIYVPHGAHQMGSMGPGSATPVPLDHGLVPLDYGGSSQLQTFGTMGRNRGSISTGAYTVPPHSGTSGEPHLDADSGDSGRGPSEEGNQFLNGDSYRSSLTPTGSGTAYPYHTYAGYRPSSRMAYRNGPCMDDMMKLHPAHCTHDTAAGECVCYPSTMEHQSLYPVRFAAHPCEPVDCHSYMYAPQYGDLAMNQFVATTNPPPPQPPPRSPRTHGTVTHAGRIRDTSAVVEPAPSLGHTDPCSTADATPDSAIGAVDDMRAVGSLPNGTTSTLLRLDLRNPNGTEDNEQDKRRANPCVYTKPSPGLPPLATRKTNVSQSDAPGDRLAN